MKPLKPFSFFFKYLFLALGAFTFFAGVFITLTVLSIGQAKTKNVLAEILDVSKPVSLQAPTLPDSQLNMAESQAMLSQLLEEKTTLPNSDKAHNTNYQVTAKNPKELKEVLEGKFASWKALNTHQNCYENNQDETNCNISAALPQQYQIELKQFLEDNYEAEENKNTFEPYRSPDEYITDIEGLLVYRIALLEIYNNANDSSEYISSLKELTENQKQIRDLTRDKEREVKMFTHPNVDVFISSN